MKLGTLSWSIGDFAFTASVIACLVVSREFLQHVHVGDHVDRNVKVRAVCRYDARYIMDIVEERYWNVYTCLGEFVDVHIVSIGGNSIKFEIRFRKPIGKKGNLLVLTGDVDDLVNYTPIGDKVIDIVSEGISDGVCVRVGNEYPYVFSSLEVDKCRFIEENVTQHFVDVPEVSIMLCREPMFQIRVGNIVKSIDDLKVLTVRSVDDLRIVPENVLTLDASMCPPHVVYRMSMPTLLKNFENVVYLLDHGLDLVWLVQPHGHGRTLTLVKTMLETLKRGGRNVAIYVKALEGGRAMPYTFAGLLLDKLRGWKRELLEQYVRVRTLEDAIDVASRHDVALLIDDFENVVARPDLLKKVLSAKCQIFAVLDSSSTVRHLYRGHVMELDRGLTVGDVKMLLKLLNFRDVDLLSDDVYRRFIEAVGAVPKKLVNVLKSVLCYCHEKNVKVDMFTILLKYVPHVVDGAKV